MKRFALIVSMLVLVAACSSDSDDTTTTAADDTATTTSVADDAATTTTAAVAGVAECVVGVWELDSETFFATMLEQMPPDEQIGEFVILEGRYLLTVNADGTFSNDRENWTFAVTSDFGDLQVRINSSQSGTYTIDGDQLSTATDPGDPPEIEFLVDGQPFQFPGGTAPFAPPAAEFSGATVSCSGDTMTAIGPDGFSSTWTRVG